MQRVVVSSPTCMVQGLVWLWFRVAGEVLAQAVSPAWGLGLV
jgi:hypothetical protein